ncbi:MAG TPA: MFS transporter [Longimicrobiaceae bacterium]|nr:MFS transporter [Longimicrobiaceae bacterium]
MVTAFVDMVGLLMVVPLLPFVTMELGGGGFVVGVLVSAFSLAQLLSAPLWGRFSDRFGRRPALLIGLGAAAVAYVVFAYADSLWLLLLSRLVQGAGGGTVGVLQAYVADATEPKDRARGLGWISAATSLGVMIGPAMGSASLNLGERAPGLLAAGLCGLNMIFAWLYLRESRVHEVDEPGRPPAVRARDAVRRVFTHWGEPAPRLIWIYAIGMGAFFGYTAILALFLEARFGITAKTIGYVFVWIGALSVLARAYLLGKAVDRFGEARVSRFGQSLLISGLVLIPFTWRIEGVLFGVEVRWLVLGVVAGLVPLGTAFTFPCVTALLSRVIEPRERGVMMGVQQSFGGASRVVFPLVTGWAYEAGGTALPFFISAVLVFGTLFLGLGLEAEREEPQPVPDAAAAD